jgi:hypothetical protein
MPSDRQIAANRSNAKKSTGPRSKAGRELTRQNARRHGLAVGIEKDPAFQDDIEKLAKIISGGTPFVSENAREVARAQLDLSRIRQIRAILFNTFYFTSTAPRDGLTTLGKNLIRLERYERRASSRCKRALRAMS